VEALSDDQANQTRAMATTLSRWCLCIGRQQWWRSHGGFRSVYGKLRGTRFGRGNECSDDTVLRWDEEDEGVEKP